MRANKLTWTEAKQRAESRSLVVKRGNVSVNTLITVTSIEEQAVLAKHYLGPPNVHTDVWMGGTDVKVDDEWRWDTGPEAKEDGGQREAFLQEL